jgi:hypothetical protein
MTKETRFPRAAPIVNMRGRRAQGQADQARHLLGELAAPTQRCGPPAPPTVRTLSTPLCRAARDEALDERVHLDANCRLAAPRRPWVALHQPAAPMSFAG